MLNWFVLANGSERNTVNATSKEGRGGVHVCDIWDICDLSVVSVKCLNKL